MVGLEPHRKYLRGRSLCHMDKMELPLPLWGHSRQPLTCTAVQACLPGVRCTEGERGEGPRSLPLSLKARESPPPGALGHTPVPHVPGNNRSSGSLFPVHRPTQQQGGDKSREEGAQVGCQLTLSLPWLFQPRCPRLQLPCCTPPSSPLPPRCGSGGCLSSPATRHAAPPRPPSKGFGNSIP